MAVLHFHKAVSEHQDWWERFEDFLHGRIDGLEFHHVAHDDACTIGSWLHGEDGAPFAHHPEFQVVKLLHKQLHELAGDLWHAKKDEAHERIEALLEEVHEIRHQMFLAWGVLNDVVGVYE